jgi:UDP-N-acetylmuramoylalanine-D-glutamate ligase
LFVRILPLCTGRHHSLQVNEFVKRARAAKIHAYIIGHLKKEMPTMMGKAKAQQRLIDNLEDEFAKVLTDNLIA